MQLSKLKLINITGLLLGASLAILFGLAWQAIQATRAHYDIRDNVLREYAVLIANEYSRRMTQDIGYKGYFEAISEIRDKYLENGHSSVDWTLTSESADIVEYIALFDGAALSILMGATEASKDDKIVEHALQESLIKLDKKSLNNRPFHAVHFLGASSQTFIFTLLGEEIIGFVVDKTALKKRLANSFERAPLFPLSLANGKLTNEFIGLSVFLMDSSMLVRFGHDGQATPNATKVMTSEYGGIFEGMMIDVSIDSSVTQVLIVGERPLLRLPYILIALVVAAGLLLVAVKQMRSERVLMAMRNRFIAEASHELRTPLTQIRLFAETLILDRAKDDQAKDKALSIINREAQRLGHLVDNILSFSQKSKRRHLVLVKERIEPIVVDAVDELELVASQLNCTFNLEIQEVGCWVDRSALHQILINLLDNALKYGGKTQIITVRVRQRGDEVFIYVIDQGKGIAEEEKEKIWGDFYRPESNSETGVGIGLSIVRELTSLMKGDCWLESMASGACFVLRFPSTDVIER